MITPFPLKTNQRYDHCIGLCLQPDTTVTLDFYAPHQLSPCGMIPGRDTCLHFNEGIVTTSCSITECLYNIVDIPEEIKKWVFQMKYRLWDSSGIIQLFRLQQEHDEISFIVTGTELKVVFNETVIVQITSEAVKEGEWSFIILKQTENDIHCQWNEQTVVILNHTLFHLSSSLYIQIGDHHSIWDLLSLSISTLFKTLFSFEMIPCSHLSVHSTSATPFISATSCLIQNCSWSLSDTLPFTHHSLQQKLQSFPSQIHVSSWNDVFSSFNQLIMKLRAIPLSQPLAANNELLHFPSCDDSTLLLLLLSDVPSSLSLIDVIIDSVDISESRRDLLLKVFIDRMKQKRRRTEESTHKQSEENQMDDFSITDSEDDLNYSHFLQVFASHFSVFLPNENDQFYFMLSKLQAVSDHSSKPNEETMLFEEIILALCQNRWLMNELITKWISREYILRWKRLHIENHESHRFDSALSSVGLSIHSSGMSITNTSINHIKFNIGIVTPAIDAGIVRCCFVLEEDRLNDEMTCLGVCCYPLDSHNYEESQQMWLYRCYSGELIAKGKKQKRFLEKCHPGGEVELLINMDDCTVSISVNHQDYGVVFENIASSVHPFVLFYNSCPPQRSVRLKEIQFLPQNSLSTSISQSLDKDVSTIVARLPEFVHSLTQFVLLLLIE